VGAQAQRENPDSCYHAAAELSDADSVNWHQVSSFLLLTKKYLPGTRPEMQSTSQVDATDIVRDQ
jgi:hypothetical protein